MKGNTQPVDKSVDKSVDNFERLAPCGYPVDNFSRGFKCK